MKELEVIQPRKSENNKAKELARLIKHGATFGKPKLGVTKKDKTISKKNRGIIKNSKKTNRLKKRHKMTQKEKKSR